METRQVPGTDLGGLAVEAFFYGFPLVFDLGEVRRFPRAGVGAVPATPYNEFGHAQQLAGPETRFVSINNDTVYSIANIDVSGGPIRLDVPDTHGRYYVLQFVDAWTNNFAYVGHRATGTEAASFVLVARDWQGEAPDGARVIRFPTNIGTIVGRWAVDGEADIPHVIELQRRLRLTPTTPGDGIPDGDPSVPEDLQFFEQLRVWIAAFPPSERDQAYQQRFEPLGLLAARSPYTDADSDLAAAMRQALVTAKQQMEQALKGGSSPIQNGWSLTYHVFDYNLDFFEVGALDDPAWKLPDDPKRYVQRALGSARRPVGQPRLRSGLCDGLPRRRQQPARRRQPLRAAFRLRAAGRRFLVGDDVRHTDFFLVANPIGRYSIGDRTAGLRRDAAGGLHDRHAARRSHRPPPPRQLATDAHWGIPADPSHVRTRRGRVRRPLRAAANPQSRLSQLAPTGVRRRERTLTEDLRAAELDAATLTPQNGADRWDRLRAPRRGRSRDRSSRYPARWASVSTAAAGTSSAARAGYWREVVVRVRQAASAAQRRRRDHLGRARTSAMSVAIYFALGVSPLRGASLWRP